MAASRRASTPSRPVRSARRRVQSYHEATTSESSADEQLDPPSRSRPRRQQVSADTAAAERPRRSTRAPASYREPSTDEDLDRVISRFPEVLANGAAQQPDHRSSPRKSRPGNNSPSKKTKISTQDSPRKRRRVEPQMPEESITAPSGPIPPWTTLPYHILFNIFHLASYPLVDYREAVALPSGKWLVDIALLCRAFAEPALAALYHTPVLIPPRKAHRIVQLLSQPQESLAINYASKVQELLVDVRLVLAYKSGPSLGYFDLSKLIEKVPHIKTLRLYHRHDGVAPLLLATHTPRWTYRDSIFDTLKRCNVRLHTFDWNARFMDPSNLVVMMQNRHREAPFRGLRDLKLFQIPSDERVAENDQEVEELIETKLAVALRELPELRRLSFTDCAVVNEVLLPRLPTTLTSLTIDNCDELTSETFAPFLASHGSHLRELVLKHNRHLNLSFIVGLAESCPNLERLSVDFIMHNWPPYYNGTPHFNHLLKPGEVPTWPKTLQAIEMLQLRNWDKAKAAAFFSSLVDSAPDLKDLRRIVISATVQMGWQDRASFRKRWIRKIERMFLRKDEPPKSTAAEAGPADGVASMPVKRQSARIAQQRLSGMDGDSDESKTPSGATTNTETEVSDVEDIKDTYVQGMCDVVQLRIDNLRPADMQFKEDDFIDSEVSGDEEWNGQDSEPDDSYAW